MLHTLTREYWQGLDNLRAESGSGVIYQMQFTKRINELYLCFNAHSRFVQNLIEVCGLSMHYLERFESEFISSIVRASHTDLLSNFLYFVGNEYKKYENEVLAQESPMEDTEPKIDVEKPVIKHRANEKKLGSAMYEIVQKLFKIGFGDYVEEAISKTLAAQLELKLEQCRGIFSRQLVNKAEEWFEEVIMGWIQWVYSNNREKINYWRRKLLLHLRKTYARIRNTEMLEIIGEYPETSACIVDIKHCLQYTSEYTDFAKNVRTQISKRLLIPGVVTPLIIDQYIQTIRVMKLLDPSALLLEHVSEPIKAHLRARPDTLRCIISSILNEEDSDLYEQLGQQYTRIPLRKSMEGQTKKVGIMYEQEDSDDLSSDEDIESALTWEPAPINKDLGIMVNPKQKRSDIISMLVNIYGTPEALLKEYKAMLAERLLSGADSSFEGELRNLELLKLRFGDVSLHHCDVMLRDMKESERIHTMVQNEMMKVENKGDSIFRPDALSVAIISKEFWPIKDETVGEPIFQLPAELQGIFDMYAKKYSTIKRMRNLTFYPHLGRVVLTLHFENGSFRFKVTPLQASIISLFNNEPKGLTADQISKQLELPISEVKRKIIFWVSKGVLKEVAKSSLLSRVTTVYVPVQRLERDVGDPDEINESVSESGRLDNEKEETQNLRELVEGFVVSMLHTSGPKTTEKIYQMLTGVYLQDKKTSFTLEELIDTVLTPMVTDGKISFDREIYTVI